MEAKKSHSFDGIMNSNGEQRLSHKEGRVPSKDSNYEWINSSSDPTTSNNFISSMEKKHVKEEEEEATVAIYDTVDSNSKENRSPYENRITGRTGNACIHNSTSEHSTTSPPNQSSKEDVVETPCKINSSNESDEATTSSFNVSQAIENQQVGDRFDYNLNTGHSPVQDIKGVQGLRASKEYVTGLCDKRLQQNNILELQATKRWSS